MYEFISGYGLPLVLFVALFLAVLVYAYYTYEQPDDAVSETDYTIRNYVDDIEEAPEQKKVSNERIETLEKEMSNLEGRIAAMRTLSSKAEADALGHDIRMMNEKIASVYR